jgi:hypothetical protein
MQYSFWCKLKRKRYGKRSRGYIERPCYRETGLAGTRIQLRRFRPRSSIHQAVEKGAAAHQLVSAASAEGTATPVRRSGVITMSISFLQAVREPGKLRLIRRRPLNQVKIGFVSQNGP